jgi:hypothetical protein
MAAVATAGRPAGDAVERAFQRGGEPAARAEFARVAPDAARVTRSVDEPFRLVDLPSELPARIGRS